MKILKHKSTRLPLIIFLLFLTNNIIATPSCPIVTENFSTLTDGTKVDSRSTGWTIDASQIPNALYFAVKSHRFQAEELGGQGIWYSKVMTVTGKPNFQVGVKITAEGTLTISEYVKIYYKLNGGAETLLDQRTGNFGTIDFQSGLLNANTVQIVVKLYNYDKATSAKSVYYIEEYRLFSNVTGCSLLVSPGASSSITCATSSVTLSPGTNTTGNVTYSWTGPNSFTSTLQNPVVSTAGTYNVTATIAASSSTATGSVVVTQNTTVPGANASANGTLECSAPSVIITAGSATSGVTYNWSGPGDFASNRAIDTVQVPGTYTVTVTNPVNGCSSASSVTVVQGTPAPGATASVSGPLTCTTTSVALSGNSLTSGVNYNWIGPNSFTSTLQNPTVNVAGTYTLTVTNPVSTCTSTAAVTVVQNGTLPGATANVSGPITCIANSVTLLGSSGTTGVTYNWSGPNSFTSTAQNPVVSATGTYTLTVTNISTGCKSTSSANVTQNTTVPGATASVSGTLNCSTASVTLTGGSSTSGVTYSWSGPNSFTSALQSPSVTNPGTYVLTITNPVNGCTSTASTTVLQSGTLPGASAGVSGAITCSVTSVTLSGSSSTSGVTYSWTGPNSFASTAQNPSVSAAGTYSLTVTNTSNGCASNATVVVNANNAAPGATASVSGTLTCNSSVTLLGSSATSGVNYNWSGPSGFASTAQSPTVSTSGTYTLTVTNPANSCISSSSVNVTASNATASDFWVEDFTFSNGTTVDNGTTSWSLQNAGSGTFSVQSNEFMASFSSANEGIWSSGVVDISSRSNVVVSAYLRSGTASTSDYFESDDYIRVYYKLNGGAETLIFGDAAGLNGVDNASSSTTITSAAFNGNTLQIVVRARNSSTTERYYFDNVKLNGTPLTTGISALASVSGVLTCSNTSVTLQGSSTASGVTYSWTGPNSFTSAVQNPAINNPGAYVLTVSNSAGCTASSIVNVSQNITAPGATAGVSGTITCASASVNLEGSSGTPGVTYNWSGPNGFISTAQNSTVNVAGAYTLTVTNPSNGCTSSQSVEVNSTAGTTSTVWLEDYTLATGTIVDNGSTSWSRTVSSGTFSVISNEFKVSGTGITTDGVWTSGSINISGKTNVTVSAGLRSSGVDMNTTGTYMDYIRVYYKLNGGSEVLFSEKLGNINNHSTTNTTVSVGSLSGTSIQIVIRARATGTDEFYYFDNIKVTGTSVLSATATANGVLGCTVNSVTLSGNSDTPGVTYSWSGPGGFTSATQNPTVSNSGVYTLTISDPANGCIATDTANVVQNLTSPGATASVNGSLNCTTTSVTLTGGSSTSGVTYSWSGSNSFNSALQSPSVTNLGTYTLTVTNPVNGCTSIASTDVMRDTIAPSATATVNGTLTCTTTSVPLLGNSTTPGVTYKWSGPGSFTSTSQNPSVANAGTYNLTVTNPANGCAATSSVQVISSTGATGTIWNEEFPHTNGTSVDNGITSWSVASTTGTFSVYNNEFRVTNTGTSAQGTWTTGIINISGKTNVSISADVRSSITGSAVMNTSGTYMDYIRFYYKLNGGSEVLFAEKLGAINSHSTYGATISANALTGSTLQIIVKARATGSDEFYYFDNVKVIGSGQIDASASVSGSITCKDLNVTLLGNSTVPGVTYNWAGPGSFSSSSQNPSVGVPGTYSLTVTDPSNDCYSVVSAIVTQNISSPGATASVSGQLSCTDALVTLSGSSSTSGVTYSWAGPGGFVSALQSPSANTLGTYTLTVTNPANECTSVASVEVTASAPSPASTFWLEDFTFANGTTVDNGTTSWLLQNVGSGTFSVQSNEFMASFGSANEGVWLSDIVNISAKSNTVVSVDLKSGTASTNDYLESDDYIRVFYKVDNGPEILMYEDYAGLGSTTNTTASATVTSGNFNAGTLQVVIRARNSHSTERYYFDNVKLTGSNQVVGNISTSVSGPITCPNPGVQLTASVTNTAATYYWIRPDNTIINQQNPTVTIPGNYNVVVSVGGCQASKTVIVTGSTVVPDISISGDHLACSSSIPALLNAVSSNTNLEYAWNGPAGFTSNVKSPSVLNAGTYTLTVTDKTNLCSNTASFAVQFGTLLWNEGFDGLTDGTIEDLGSTAWSVNNSQIHTVDLSDYSGESGIPYYFEVRNNKLAAKSTRGEVVWTTYPIDISGADNVFARLDVSGEGTLNDATDCGKDCFDYDYIKVFYKINGGSEIPFTNLGSIPGKLALSNLKVSSNIPNGNTLQIVVKAYNTGNNELFYFDNIQVLALGQGSGAVAASASGPINCVDSIITLTPSPNIVGNSYSWTGPGGFSSSQPIVEVNQPGTYSLVVIGNTGCVNSDTVTVEVLNNISGPSEVTATNNGPLTCIKANTAITASSTTPGATYYWSGPNSFSAQTSSAIVSLPGSYTVKITNPVSGCSVIESTDVQENKTIPANVTLVSDEPLTCIKTAAILTAGTSTPGVTYSWTGPNGFSSNMPAISVSISGAYIVTLTNPTSGCTASKSIDIREDKILPVDVTAGNNGPLTCINTSVLINAGSTTTDVTYSWSGPNGFTANTAISSIAIPGLYYVTVTNPSNGCADTKSTEVVEDKAIPVNATAINNGPLTCIKTEVMLTATSTTTGVTYSWLGPNGFIANSATAVVQIPGVYSVTITNPVNGCTVAKSTEVIENTIIPDNVTAINDGPLTCSETTVKISATSTTTGVNYSWSGPNGFSANTAIAFISVPGVYTIIVSNPVSGCIQMTSTEIFQRILAPGVTISVPDILTCSITSVVLEANSPTAGVEFIWSGPLNFTSTEKNPITTKPGFYEVIVTSPANGCTSTNNVVVENDTSVAENTNVDVSGILSCVNNSVTLAGSSSTINATYNWTGPNGFNSMDQNIDVSTPGIYILHIGKPANGCVALVNIPVLLDTITPKGIIAEVSGILSCTASSVKLTGSSSTNEAAFLWTGPGFTSTEAIATATNPGNYVLKVTNPVNGCFAVKSVTIIKDHTPPAGVSTSVSGKLTCTSQSVIISASSLTPDVAYNWIGPGNYLSNESAPHVSNPGTYTVTVTSSYNNCVITQSIEVQQNIGIPEGVLASASGLITCSNSSVTLSSSSSTPGALYNWVGPEGYTSDLQNPIVNLEGEFTVTVTNTDNGCKTNKTVLVDQDTTKPENITATASGDLNCITTFVTLTGSSTTEGAEYNWTDPENNEDPSAVSFAITPGLYILKVTDPENGCSGTKNVSVVLDTIHPVSNIISQDRQPVALTDNAISAQLVNDVAYFWAFSSPYPNWYIVSGDTTPDLIYHAGDTTTTANFILTLTSNLNGCTSSRQILLTAESSLKNARILHQNEKNEKDFQINIYPNPFCDKAQIEFTSILSEHIIIELYGNGGNLVEVLFDSKVEANQSHKVTLDGAMILDGTYYLTFKSDGNYFYTHKLLLIK